MSSLQPLWRQIQRQNFTSTASLVEFLKLDETLRRRVLASSSFPLKVPVRLAQKMQKNTLDDPLVRQFLPLIEENEQHAGFTLDPVQDATFRKGPRLLQKYQGRALMLATSACAMHCRFCFRRNYPYEEGETSFEEELRVIEEDTSLSEIILSGGDPLSLSDEKLGALIAKLATFPHVKRLRFHTRFVIGIPERIDASFLQLLENCPLQVFFVIHCNHVRELDEEVIAALKKIQKLGIPVLNHSVLLKGVNDALDILKELVETLAGHGILPYYLNQLDKAAGTAHFEVPEEQGLELIKTLTSSTSGYCVPKYAREIPGKLQKTILR